MSPWRRSSKPAPRWWGEVDWEAVKAHVAGQAPAVAAAVERWLAEHPDWAAAIVELDDGLTLDVRFWLRAEARPRRILAYRNGGARVARLQDDEVHLVASFVGRTMDALDNLKARFMRPDAWPPDTLVYYVKVRDYAPFKRTAQKGASQ